MQKLTNGYLINGNIVAIVEQGCELQSNTDEIKRVQVCIDEECIRQWYEELKLGIIDDWNTNEDDEEIDD